MINKNKILKTYNINKKKEEISKQSNIPNIVKIPEVSINKTEIPAMLEKKHKKNSLKVIRNEDGIITDIEVSCKCGEIINIKLDY